MGLEQVLVQKQTLKFSQDLQQSVRILQFSTTELTEYINTQLEQNPFLIENTEETWDENGDSAGVSSQDHDNDEFEIQEGNLISKSELYYSDLPSAGNYYNKDQPTDYQGLDDDLGKQIHLEFPDKLERKIAVYLADLLDENGYIHFDQAELLAMFSISSSNFNAILTRLQKFEPTGIFARNLAECLILQLKEQNKYDKAFATIIANLEFLQQGDFTKLSKLCGLDQDKFYEYVRQLKSLNPRPGNDLKREKYGSINPDVIVTKAGNIWNVDLNWEMLPKIKVHDDYYCRVKKLTKKQNDKQFLSERFYQANWLVKSLKTRAETLLKVSQKILELQQDFFNKGVGFLKPMILSNIATELGVNNSTVSRVVNNKYMMTPHGCFELKFFFSSGLDNVSDFDTTSSSNVKNLIKTLIEQETITSILSDEQIVLALSKCNINIARRTVSKYREELQIPGSSARKSIKALAEIR